MPDALRLALGTFTAIRVPAPRHVDSRVAGHAMLLAPVAAAPLALAWVVLGALTARDWLPGLVAGALAVGAGALLSRVMHLDGLADTADGLAAGYDRGRSLEVMRRGDTGPAGAAALVLVLLVQVASLGELLQTVTGAVLGVAALLASRVAPAVACRRGVPAARPEGLGQTVAGSVSPVGLGGLLLVVAVVAAGIAVAVGSPWYAGLLVALACPLAAWTVTRRVVVRLGGVTGDTIGAAIEIALTTALVVASALHSLPG